MSPSGRARGGFPLAACLVALLLAPGRVHAGDDGETIEQANDTIRAIAAAVRAKDGDALGEAFVRAVELHNGLEGERMRKRLQAAIGSVLRSKRAAPLRGEALSALEQLDDGDGVFKQLRPLLPATSDTAVDADGLYAIQVVGSVRAPRGIAYLAALATKGKHRKARVAAVTSLGKYHELEKGRVKALGHLLALLRALQPVKGRPRAVDAQKTRAALEPATARALDELTYKDLGSAKAWLAWAEAHEGRYRAAFGK